MHTTASLPLLAQSLNLQLNLSIPTPISRADMGRLMIVASLLPPLSCRLVPGLSPLPFLPFHPLPSCPRLRLLHRTDEHFSSAVADALDLKPFTVREGECEGGLWGVSEGGGWRGGGEGREEDQRHCVDVSV